MAAPSTGIIDPIAPVANDMPPPARTVVPAAVLATGIPTPAALDIFGRFNLLKEAFPGKPDAPSAAPDRTFGLWPALVHLWTTQRRLLKMTVGALILIVAGWMPVRALLETTSTEAIVNARLITLRAPIEGQIGSGLGSLRPGAELEPGVPLLRVVNPRAERGQLDELRRQLDRLQVERPAQLLHIDELKALRADLVAQTHAFQEGRIRQLEARSAELTSEIASAAASLEEAERALTRAKPLAEGGNMSAATYEKVKRDARIAVETHSALRHRLAGIEVELAAIRLGVFVGDSYNDRPRSSQRADEIAQRLSQLQAESSERDARIAYLRTEIEDETRRYAQVAAADITAPVRGSVWEVLTAPGEAVNRGQDLVRVLDCSGVLVTATVGEAAYNRLRIGDAARFRLRGEGTDHLGRIIGLTGVAAAPANLAIQPSALAKEPYRVTVAIPDLVGPERCDVGRTGRVTFGK